MNKAKTKILNNCWHLTLVHEVVLLLGELLALLQSPGLRFLTSAKAEVLPLTATD